MIQYTVRLADATRHWFEVDCSIDTGGATVEFDLPSWIPGSYLLREYARHVVRAAAFDEQGNTLPVEKTAHNVWRCNTAGGSVTLRLIIYALDESVRGSWFDTQRAWFNGPCLFVRPRGVPDTEVRVRLEAPAQQFDQWHVATAMTSRAVDERGFGDYVAADYGELLDHPFVMGELERVDFEACGVPHSFVVLGRHNGDLQQVAKDLGRLCTSHIEFFGAPPPFDRYLFLCLAVAEGYGGLEHAYSSCLMFRSTNLPRSKSTGISRSYQRLLSLASHEYFHAWHVKRSKPAAFMPYELAERNLTRQLWVFEGITSYYQDRFLLRCGLIDKKAYLTRLGELITAVLSVPGRHMQSLAEASFDAWDKLYKPNANTPNASISYYAKGALVALALDLEIRLRHDTRLSLDDIVQTFWQEFGAQNIGVPETGFESLARRLAGEELADFFDRTIRGTEDPPLKALFAEFGIELQPGKRRTDVWLGILPGTANDGLRCATVLDGGPAQSAGLNPGDIIFALDRRKVTSANIREVLHEYEPGSAVTVHYFRNDELLEAPLELSRAPADSHELRLLDTASEVQLARRQAWLAG